MKKKLTTGAVLVFVFAPNISCACQTFAECWDSLPSGYCCCDNGSNTTYYCPSGWTVSGTTCVRSDTAGNDSTGSYVISYDTCDATPEIVYCYVGVPHTADVECLCKL